MHSYGGYGMMQKEAGESSGCDGQFKPHGKKFEEGRAAARLLEQCSSLGDCELMIRGLDVSLTRLEAALTGLEDISASYQVCVDKEHNLDVVDVYIRPDEPMDELFVNRKQKKAIIRRVARAVKSVAGVTPRVSVVKQPKCCAGSGRVTVLDKRRKPYFV